MDLHNIAVQIQFSYHLKAKTLWFQVGLKRFQNTSDRDRNFEKNKLPRISNSPEFRRFHHIYIFRTVTIFAESIFYIIMNTLSSTSPKVYIKW